MNLDNISLIKNFLHEIGIQVENMSLLDGQIIPRELLLNENTYKKILKYIPYFKNIFSSSYMTSLHNEAKEKQKWPLLNIVRQVLRSCNYLLMPKRLSNGYNKDGKKIYKRVYIITKNIMLT
tara:strand:- start:106 stop:471 length:366 start_codon:yes stop_codon:yes gene_type:complete